MSIGSKCDISVAMLNRELMSLAGAQHGVIVGMIDVVEDEWVYRWFADGRGVVFRLRPDDLRLSLNAIDDKLAPVVKMWREATPTSNPEKDYARLVDGAKSVGYLWAEDWLKQG